MLNMIREDVQEAVRGGRNARPIRNLAVLTLLGQLPTHMLVMSSLQLMKRDRYYDYFGVQS